MGVMVERKDLEFLLPNMTKLVRESMRLIDRHFPVEDQALERYLLDVCNTPAIAALSDNVERFCAERWDDVGGTGDARKSFQFVRNWLLTARMLQTLSTQLQIELPNVAAVSSYEQILYISRVLHDASIASIEKVQLLLPPETVATAYRLVEQGEARRFEADRIRQELASGKRIDVFRLVSAYGNFLQWSPFWSLGIPPLDLDPEVLERQMQDSQSLPFRLRGPSIIVRGQLNPTATFVLEPGHQSSVGQSTDTIVTTYDGIEVVRNSEMIDFIGAMTKPVRG